MSGNAVVRARIDEQVKEEATVVLKAMGLTVSDAFRMMLIRVAREKVLPFEPLAPNAATIAAMKEARRRFEVVRQSRRLDVGPACEGLNAPASSSATTIAPPMARIAERWTVISLPSSRHWPTTSRLLRNTATTPSAATGKTIAIVTSSRTWC